MEVDVFHNPRTVRKDSRDLVLRLMERSDDAFVRAEFLAKFSFDVPGETASAVVRLDVS